MTQFARRAALSGLATLILTAGASPALAQFGGRASGPTEVGVVALADSTVPYQVTLPGRAVAYEQVDIRPRVEGEISAIPYQPGHRVEKGAVLFKINGEDYQALAAAAEAAVAQAKASLSAAQDTLARYKKLEGQGITAEQVSTAQVAVVQAQASLLSAKASLDTAQLNLERTTIVSPITGIADVPTVSVGALVTANQTTALTTVTRLDPIYVDVEESIRRINEVRDEVAAGRLKTGDQLDVTLQSDTGPAFTGKGTLVSPGSTVSTSTGTTTFRFQFANPDRRLLPGMFLRVEVTLGTIKAILVPQGPTHRAADGSLKAYIAEDGKAKEVTLATSGTYKNAWIVTSGVEPGEKLIVDGLSNLRAGAEVKTVPVTISDEGVVTTLKSEAKDGAKDGAKDAAQSSEKPAAAGN